MDFGSQRTSPNELKTERVSVDLTQYGQPWEDLGRLNPNRTKFLYLFLHYGEGHRESTKT